MTDFQQRFIDRWIVLAYSRKRLKMKKYCLIAFLALSFGGCATKTTNLQPKKVTNEQMDILFTI